MWYERYTLNTTVNGVALSISSSPITTGHINILEPTVILIMKISFWEPMLILVMRNNFLEPTLILIISVGHNIFQPMLHF